MKGKWRNTVRAVALLSLTATLGACALTGRDDTSRVDPDVVARDLVYTLAQVRELHPLKSTLQVNEPNTVFGEHVLALLDEAGYGLQEVDADQGPNFVRYSTAHIASETGERTRYLVSVGDISVERDYGHDPALGTLPRSRLIVSGVEAQTLGTDEALFAETLPEELMEVAFADDLGPELREVVLGAAAPTERLTAFGAAVKRNMYETLTSNYADVFADFDDVRQTVLVFPDDSLRLGEPNKEMIASFVNDLDPSTDVLSVIGCSHGTTEIDNGNELLAIGRANRVKEAFLFAGIDHDQVLEESCWAGDHFEMMPPRGVVLTLKRRSDNG